MKKEEFMEAYENIGKIEDLLIEAGRLFGKLPGSIQQSILDYHREPNTMQHCLRWGLQATKEIREDWHTVAAEHNLEISEEVDDMGKITFHLSKPILLDKLNALAAEYSVSVELLINLAVMRLIDDVEFLRDLRTGEIRTVMKNYLSSLSK